MIRAEERLVVRGLGLVVFLLASGVAFAQERPAKLSVDLGAGVKMDFVPIKPGSFQMGSEKGFYTEKPVHQVTISKPFFMGVYEVTEAQWKALMGDNPSDFKGDVLPVERVSWEDCQKFLAKLNEKLGKGMTCRLPTEAEWEYACRAGSKTEYCFGDDQAGLGAYAWFEGNSENKPHPVGQKNPNAWGLYDMYGNVWEWCLDWQGDYGPSAATDPAGPDSGHGRVFRGGSWSPTPMGCRSSDRTWSSPSSRYWDVGFRVVVVVAGVR